MVADTVTAGNRAKSSSTGAWLHQSLQRPPAKMAGWALTTGDDDDDLERHLWATSMRRLFARKKSEPRIGFFTSANRKRCVSLRPGRDKKIDLLPKVLMADPFAAVRDTEGQFLCAADAGKTDMSAPLSSKKERQRRRQ